MAPVLEVRGLTKAYGDVTALDGVSFSLQPGQICGLLGPNGAGKTTAIRIILGLVYPDAGSTVLLDSEVSPGAPVLARVGAIVEEAAFAPFLTGRQALEHHQRIGGAADRDDVERVLALSGLGRAADRKVKTYSHGMRQRLGLARAMLGSPEILVLDEPTTGLDPAGIREVREMLAGLAGSGCAVLLSSHLLTEIELLCTHVVVMQAGRVIAHGELNDVVGGERALIAVDEPERAVMTLKGMGVTTEPRGRELLVTNLNGLGRADLVRRLVEAGIGVDRVEARTRLEDAFFEITEDNQ